MSEQDKKVIEALEAYDSAPVGSAERVAFGAALEKVAAKISERDYYRIAEEYAKMKTRKVDPEFALQA